MMPPDSTNESLDHCFNLSLSNTIYSSLNFSQCHTLYSSIPYYNFSCLEHLPHLKLKYLSFHDAFNDET